MSNDMPAILREQAKCHAGVITRVQGVAMGTRFDDWAAGRAATETPGELHWHDVSRQCAGVLRGLGM
jgi:hypothetical protein